MEKSLKEKLFEDIESGKTKYASENDYFNFGCKGCGSCCMDRNDIILNPIDIYNLSVGLKMESKDVLNTYCRIVQGENTKLPVVLPKYKEKTVFGRNHKVCPFLKPDMLSSKEKYICGVHHFKPYVCAIYPLGRITKINPKDRTKEINYIVQPAHCKGATDASRVKVGDWIEKFNLKKHEHITNKYNDFIEKTSELRLKEIFENKNVTEKTKNIIYSVMVNILYVGLENGDIEQSLDKRYSDLLGALAQAVDFYKKLEM